MCYPKDPIWNRVKKAVITKSSFLQHNCFKIISAFSKDDHASAKARRLGEEVLAALGYMGTLYPFFRYTFCQEILEQCRSLLEKNSKAC